MQCEHAMPPPPCPSYLPQRALNIAQLICPLRQHHTNLRPWSLLCQDQSNCYIRPLDPPSDPVVPQPWGVQSTLERDNLKQWNQL